MKKAKKIITVLGARPQFIKSALISQEIRQHPELEEVIVHTGQHYDWGMNDIFFQELDIPKPKYNLNIHNLPHGAMTGRMLEGIESVLIQEKPDLVMIYGDTNTTLAGALAASKLHIHLAHVEAGLRSFNMKMPEEINRLVSDRLSNYLFCPTQTAVDNLKLEGFSRFDCQIVFSGDVMLDLALKFRPLARQVNCPGQFVLVTLHREDSLEDPDKLKSILEALNQIHRELAVVFPVHPRTARRIMELGLKTHFPLREPIGYLENLYLLEHCQLVLTDSGGLQKEAYFFQKPALILREQTEWVELIKNGSAVLVGSDLQKISDTFQLLKNKKIFFQDQVFGQGKAARSIIETLQNDL